jgi:hypothetical protein
VDFFYNVHIIIHILLQVRRVVFTQSHLQALIQAHMYLVGTLRSCLSRPTCRFLCGSIGRFAVKYIGMSIYSSFTGPHAGSYADPHALQLAGPLQVHIQVLYRSTCRYLCRSTCRFLCRSTCTSTCRSFTGPHAVP